MLCKSKAGDLLADMKQKYWQVLPVGPTSFGDSHYQPLPSCAGNFYLIDLVDEIRCYNWGADGAQIDYAIIAENRQKILQKAFERFQICRRRSDMGKSSI